MHRQSQRERFEAWASSPPRKWWVERADENHNYLLEGEYVDEGVQRAWEGWRAACPEGWQAVPQKITAETGHKKALIGEFSESITLECLDCYSEGYTDPDCEVCGGEYRYQQPIPIGWDIIKRIHDRIVSVSAPPKAPC